MDKYEYKVRSEEISNLIDMEKYAQAATIADTIDWRRVKSVNMLLKIAALYRINRRNEHSREILMLAYDRYPTNRSVVYSLCELSIELDDVVAAIEYYKQFVKLSPKDIGVFTLRYRILEAQQVSLEERIALLEELKKRDYQEEWAYELAYLYHRMGLATKCVEECDDIILWFGDGSYVVKAMELKALHAPLSEQQLEKYNALIERAKDGYSSDHGNEDGYLPEGYTDENYPADGYMSGGYAGEDYTDGGYAGEDYTDGSYAGEGYADEDYTDGYLPEGYADENYAGEGYTIEEYTDESYARYGEGTYTQDGYADDGYGNLGYIQNSQGYTGEFYVEQAYDENGNPIPAADYENGSYDYGENYKDEDYYNEKPAYGNAAYVQQSNVVPMPSGGVDDMSQYNTINFQKVVAESMKELFPDDDDVFAEDREKFNPTMKTDDAMPETGGDTRVFSRDGGNEAIAGSDGHMASAPDIAKPEMKEPRPQTGRIAQLVTSVSEAAPEPDTGAIKKVLIPGKDARFIKSDSDIDELRDTTEQSVDEEQSRMEHNDENVYHEQSLMDMEAAQTAQEQPSGSVNLDEALVEWERIKLDNAKKRQEELKKHISTQTGKILANFDSSIKEGILDELEREGNESQKGAGAGASDSTPEGTRKQESDDEFDVAYVSDKKGVVNTVSQAFEDGNEDPEKTAAHEKEEYVAQLKLIVAQQLDESPENTPRDEAEPESSEYYEDEAEPENSEYYEDEAEPENSEYYEDEAEPESSEYYEDEAEPESSEYYEDEAEPENSEYYEDEAEPENSEYYGDEAEPENSEYYGDEAEPENSEYYEDEAEAENLEYYEEGEESEEVWDRHQEYPQYEERPLDPEDALSIAEMAKEDALKTQEIKMNTADLSTLSEKIVETTNKEATGARREEIREFTPEEQTLFENFAVTKKIKKQIIYALDNITLSAYTGNVIITGDAGIDTVRMAKNLLKEHQAANADFSGRLAKITGEAFNQRNVKEVFAKLDAGGIIIEKANGMTEETLYEMALNLNQENIGIVVIMEDTKKEITKLLEKQAMIADYFNIRIDLMEMDNNALVAYAKNYALALEYSIDELGTLALYTRIANMQSGNHVVTKDEVRDIIDEAIWKSKKSKVKNFVDVLFARRYDNEDMIVLRERDFM